MIDARRGMQPFRDEAVAAAAAYQIRKKAYFESVPDSVLTEINRRRLAKGKNRVRKTVEREDRKPVTSFLRYDTFPRSITNPSFIINLLMHHFIGHRYANELRASPEGRNIIENHPSGLVASKEFVKIAAAKWRNMDASAKAVSFYHSVSRPSCLNLIASSAIDSHMSKNQPGISQITKPRSPRTFNLIEKQVQKNI